MRRIEGKLLLIYFVLITMIVGLIVMGYFIIDDKKKDNLPIMKIVLNDTTLEVINTQSKEEKYVGNRVLIDDDGDMLEYNDVTLSGHGNASWEMSKKSYNLKFKNKVDLLGLGKGKKWVLVSNGFDGTSMRNDLAYYIARLVDSSYKIRGTFVRLMMGDEDLGVYYLVNKIGIDKNSVDLRGFDGLLIELDNPYCEAEEKWERTERIGDCLVLKDVVNDDDSVDVLWQDFIKQYNEFEEAVLNQDFIRMSELIDIESWAEYYLIGEFASNPDMYVTSWYLYKDGANDRIHSVLAWDFDTAFGNKNWGDWSEEFYSPTNMMARLEYTFGNDKNIIKEDVVGCKYDTGGSIMSPMMCHLIEMPEFREEVIRIYNSTLKNRRDEIIEYIKKRANYLRDDIIVNNEKWNLGSFDEEVDYLIWWVEERFKYFDESYFNSSLENEASEL